VLAQCWWTDEQTHKLITLHFCCAKYCYYNFRGEYVCLSTVHSVGALKELFLGAELDCVRQLLTAACYVDPDCCRSCYWHDWSSCHFSSLIFTCVNTATRYCFCQRLWVCASVCRKSWNRLIGNWCNLVGICLIENAGSDWKLVTFDLDLWPWAISVLVQFRLYILNGST